MLLSLQLTEQEFKLLHRESIRTGRLEEDILEDVLHGYFATLPGYLPEMVPDPERDAMFRKIMDDVLRDHDELFRRLAKC